MLSVLISDDVIQKYLRKNVNLDTETWTNLDDIFNNIIGYPDSSDLTLSAGIYIISKESIE